MTINHKNFTIYFFSVLLLLIFSSCEEPSDIKNKRVELYNLKSQLFSRYNSINKSDVNEMSNVVDEFITLKNKVVQYTENANSRGYEKKNSLWISQIDGYVNNLKEVIDDIHQKEEEKKRAKEEEEKRVKEEKRAKEEEENSKNDQTKVRITKTYQMFEDLISSYRDIEETKAWSDNAQSNPCKVYSIRRQAQIYYEKTYDQIERYISTNREALVSFPDLSYDFKYLLERVGKYESSSDNYAYLAKSAC